MRKICKGLWCLHPKQKSEKTSFSCQFTWKMLHFTGVKILLLLVFPYLQICSWFLGWYGQVTQVFDSLLLVFGKAGYIFYAGLMLCFIFFFFFKHFPSICHNINTFSNNYWIKRFGVGNICLQLYLRMYLLLFLRKCKFSYVKNL